MRHRKHTVKLGRTMAHRDSMLSNLVCSLIEHERVVTTLPKAKAMRPLAERMVTLGKRGEIQHRRRAVARLHSEGAVRKLFADIAPRFTDRPGGYTRILQLPARTGDAAPQAMIEWVADAAPAARGDGKRKGRGRSKE